MKFFLGVILILPLLLFVGALIVHWREAISEFMISFLFATAVGLMCIYGVYLISEAIK